MTTNKTFDSKIAANFMSFDFVENWTICCKSKELFLINVDDAIYMIKRNVDEKSNNHMIKQWFENKTNNRYFCVESESKKTLKIIKSKKFNFFVRDSQKNKSEVIYAFRYRAHDLNDQSHKNKIMINWHHSLIHWHHSSNTLTSFFEYIDIR
jgi:hypothetical protein